MPKAHMPSLGLPIRYRAKAYDKTIGLKVVDLIATGSLVKDAVRVCGISESTFWRWAANSPDLRQAYTRARSSRTDVWAEEMVAIADNATDPRKAAVQISARQWVMAKVDHGKWGDRRDVNTNFRAEIDAMTPEQRDERAAALLRKLRFIAGQDQAPTIDAEPAPQTAGIGSNPADNPADEP